MIQDEILEILKESKVLARRFYRLTGKLLGVTGEVAEYEAARILSGLGVTVFSGRNFCISVFNETLTPTGGITCSALHSPGFGDYYGFS